MRRPMAADRRRRLVAAPRRSRPGWCACSTAKPFLIFICLLPAVGLLLVFLTYPLGLGIWLAFTDTTIGRSGSWVGLENFEYLFEDPIFWQAVFYSVFYTGVATVGKFGARPLAGAAAEQPPAVQEHPARHHPAALDRADGALGDRLLVDLRPAVLDHLLRAGRRAGLREHLHRLPRHGLAGALVADRRQHLARHPVRRDLAARRPADHLALALRGGDARRRHAPGSASASSPSRCCCRSWRS